MKNVIHIKLTRELRKAVKIRALATDRTVSEYITDLVEADLRTSVTTKRGDGEGEEGNHA